MIEILVNDSPDWERIVEEIRSHGAAMVAYDAEGLRPLTPIVFSFKLSGDALTKATGQIIQIFPGKIAISFSGVEKQRLLAVRAPKSTARPPEPKPAVDVRAPVPSPPPVSVPPPRSRTSTPHSRPIAPVGRTQDGLADDPDLLESHEFHAIPDGMPTRDYDAAFTGGDDQVSLPPPDVAVFEEFDAPLTGTKFNVPPPPEASTPPGESGPAAAPDERPLWMRFQEMNKAEKIKLARHGNADARRLITKDKDPSLQLHMLGNNGITPREVASLVRSGSVSQEFLRRVIKRQDLVSNPMVVEAVVRNPFTPIKLAVQLVSKLQLDTARRIAKQGNLRSAVVSAARKRVIKR